MPESIGFLGLGEMGSRMARRLIDSGVETVVWTRTGSKAQALRGAVAVEHPGEVAARCDIVFGCLLDDIAVDAVYRQLLRAARAGQIFVEHGTFSPALARELSALARPRGAHFIDAPVTGGPEGAAAGTLIAMAGADVAVLASITPVMSAYLAECVPIGPSGSGLQLKLVNQMLVSAHMAAAAEAGALLRAMQIPLDAAMSVLERGWAASAMLSRELPRVLAGDFASTGTTIGALVGVQSLVAASYSEAGIRPRLLPLLQRIFLEGSEDFAGADPAALVTLYAGAAE